MPRHDDSTEVDIRRAAGRPAAEAAPAGCEPGHPCDWLRDEPEIRRALRALTATTGEVRDQVAQLRADLGRGAVRFEQLGALPQQFHAMAIDLGKLQDAVGLLQRIVYGACAVVGVGVITALLALIVTAGPG